MASQPCFRDRRNVLPSGERVSWAGICFKVYSKDELKGYPYAANNAMVYSTCFAHTGHPALCLGHPGDAFIDVSQRKLWGKVGEDRWKLWSSLATSGDLCIHHPYFTRHILFINSKGEVVWTLPNTVSKWCKKTDSAWTHDALLEKMVHHISQMVLFNGAGVMKGQMINEAAKNAPLFTSDNWPCTMDTHAVREHRAWKCTAEDPSCSMLKPVFSWDNAQVPHTQQCITSDAVKRAMIDPGNKPEWNCDHSLSHVNDSLPGTFMLQCGRQ